MARTPKIQMLRDEKRAGASLAAVYGLRMLGMFLVLPVLVLHAQALGGTAAQGGMAIAAYGLTQALLQLPLGIASDYFGRKRVIYLGLAVFALGSFIAAVADSITWLIIGRAVQGAGAVSAAVTALLADLTREEVRTRAMAAIGLTIGLTFAGSMVVAPLLSHWLGVSGLFVLTGLSALAAVAVVAKITPNPLHSKRREDAQAQPARLGEVWRNGQLMRLNFGIFALQSVMMAVFAALPAALVALGLSKEAHWQLYLPAVVIGLLLMVPAIIVGETRNRLKAVFVGGIALIALALCGLYAGLHSLWAVAAALTVYFVGFNILEASLPSIVSKIAPPDLKGTAMGVYNTAQSLGVFVGGAAGGMLFQAFGFGGVTAAALVLTLLWLILAAASPAPKPVRNLMFAVPADWQPRRSELAGSLKAVAGVEAVAFSADGQTVYIKTLQQGCNEAQIQHLLSGA